MAAAPPIILPAPLIKVIPTTSDAQCVYKWMSEAGGHACDTKSPHPDVLQYDPATCAYYKGRCYSTTAPQCAKSSECGVSWTGECVNKKKGGSSLYCRHGGFLGACACTKATPKASDWFKVKGSILKDY